ncbi:HET-domain-containing protein [Annulohypoxylon moriforme]|nr:HET-domain-containing protein [Annulohypoxylon moriforme]
MTITIPPLARLCDTCRVLQFDDSTLPGAYQAGSEAEGYYLEVPLDMKRTSSWNFKLDFFVLDSLPDLPRLGHTAKNPCDFCDVLRRSVQKYTKPGFDKVLVSLFYQWYPYNDSHSFTSHIGLKSLVAQLIWIGTDGSGDHLNSSTYLHFAVDSPSTPCARWLRLESPPQDETLCPENIIMIFRNFKYSYYTQFIQPNIEPVYPTRLIDISNDSPASCRLIDTRSDATFLNSSGISYVALSYCWGSQNATTQQFKTEKHSLNDRLNGFKFDEVPPILCDAILVTRALNIRYLWMDAVCIIQDDLEDWEKESSRMSVVFQNAALTICTPASASCQQGFLARDWITTSIKYQSEINKAISGSYILRLIGEVTSPNDAAVNCFYFSIYHSHWARRGWVLQEYELSQRVAIFGRTKLHAVSEVGLQSETCDSLSLQARGKKSVYYQQHWDHWDKYTTWTDLVANYSQRKLSRRSDKLPAISGLASRSLDSSSNRYLAGHMILHIDLFWISVTLKLHRDSRLTREQLVDSLQFQDPYIAPSWSWASREYQIAFQDESFGVIQNSRLPQIKAECNIVRASTSLKGSNPYGAVSNGIIVMSSIVVPLALRIVPLGTMEVEHGPWQENKNGGYVADISFDWNTFEHTGRFDGLSLVLLGSRKIEENFNWDGLRITYSIEGGRKIYKNTSRWIVGGIPGHGRVNLGDENLIQGILPNVEGISYGTSSADEWARSGQLDEDADRYAYGIVVQPASEPGKYLRVGAFFSVPRECGGLRYFRNRPTQTIEII